MPDDARVINVLLVEDDPGDVLMTREAFDEHLHNRLDVVTDGAAALSYLRCEGPYSDAPRPDLILLDLNLPRRDGREVLREVKDGTRVWCLAAPSLMPSSIGDLAFCADCQ